MKLKLEAATWGLVVKKNKPERRNLYLLAYGAPTDRLAPVFTRWSG